ncbi:MAG: hypothetical protein ACTH1D_14445, partial [Mycobacteriaceae bacterium]
MTKNEALEQADADERGEFHPTGEVWINPDHPGAFLVLQLRFQPADRLHAEQVRAPAVDVRDEP